MGETPLDDDDLLKPLKSRIDKRTRAMLLNATPLWYYVLCEAAALGGGTQLGPVGGRIVGEVLLGLLEGDPQSYLRQWPRWRPELSNHEDRSFTMGDLVRFTQHHR